MAGWAAQLLGVDRAIVVRIGLLEEDFDVSEVFVLADRLVVVGVGNSPVLVGDLLTTYRSASRRRWTRLRRADYARGATTRVSKSRPRQTSSAFRRQVKTSLPPGAIPVVGSSAT